MNKLIEFLKNKENRTVVGVGLLTVVLGLLGMYYWQLLTGRVLLPQTLEQFPLTIDQTAVKLWTEIEDQAQFPNSNPRNGDEFNVVVGIEYLQSNYFDQLDLNISYPYGDLQFMNWYSSYHHPSGSGPVIVNQLSDKDIVAGGNSQVRVLNIRNQGIGKQPLGKESFIVLRFKRLTAGSTALQWYGNSTISYSFTHTSPLVTYTLPVTGSHVLSAVGGSGSDMCGGIQGLQCPSGKNCVYSDGTTTAPYPDAAGTCQVVNPAVAQCLNNGGIEWRTFNNGCVDRCQLPGEAPMCTMALTAGCDCGVDACWDGGKCVTNPGLCPLKTQGDANCDGNISLVDFETWRQEYESGAVGSADFNGSGTVTLVDFEIWRQGYE